MSVAGAGASAMTMGAAGEHDPERVRVGAVFAGDFRVVESLAAGGMGAVYIAEQLSTGKRRALKVMHASLGADAKLRDRFEQEARVGARIESEHIVEVVAAGVDGVTGMPWLAMELLRGDDLGRFIARHGPVLARDLGAIFEPLCHAIGAAHRAHVVHRDLKPENIFVAEAQRAREARTVKVLDFGIAKIVAESDVQSGVIGTPLWMAPEQTRVSVIDARTDVWALGLIAFFALTGRSYWSAGNRENVSLGAVLQAVTSEPIVRPSLRAGEWNGADRLPYGFDEWFARCVNRDIEGRFANADDAWSSLAPIIAGRANLESANTQARPFAPATSATVPTPAPSPSRASSVAPMRWALFGVAGLAFVAFVAGAIAFSRSRRSAPLDDVVTTIRVRDGRFLGAIGGGGVATTSGLRSDATTLGSSETFTLVPYGANESDTYAIRTRFGTYLTAAHAGGMAGAGEDAVAVKTDAMTAGPTETFHLVAVAKEPTDPECTKAHAAWGVPCVVVAIRTSDGAHFLSAIQPLTRARDEHRDRRPIHADATTVNAWELFVLDGLSGR